MVEGVFRRSRNSIRPIELGRRLIREMDDHRTVDVKGQRVVPNDFTIHARRPTTTPASPTSRTPCKTELVEAVREYAREEGYHFMGPVTVDLRVDNSLKPGRFGITSQLKQAEAGKRPGTIVMPSGERIELTDEPQPDRPPRRLPGHPHRHQHQPSPRRDPPRGQRLRGQRPRLDERHLRQRRAPARRPPPRRRRHRHRRRGQPALRGVLTAAAGTHARRDTDRCPTPHSTS